MTLAETTALVLKQRELYGEGYVHLAKLAKDLGCLPVHDLALALRETYGLGHTVTPSAVARLRMPPRPTAVTLTANEVAEELCAIMHAAPDRDFARSELLGRIGRDVRGSVYQLAIASLCYAGTIVRSGHGKQITYRYNTEPIADDGRVLGAVS